MVSPCFLRKIDPYTNFVAQVLAGQRKVVTFGFEAGDVQAHDIAWTAGAWQFKLVDGFMKVCLVACHIAGRHNVLNALAATACTLAAGMNLSQIVKGLKALSPLKGAPNLGNGKLRVMPLLWWTTPTTPTQILFAPPSMCWLNCLRAAHVGVG